MSGLMTCGPARRLVWVNAGPRSVSDAVIAAQSHQSLCSQCQRFERDMQALRDATRAVPLPPAPLEVRNRIFAAVARARAGQATRRRPRLPGMWLAATAGLLLMSGAAMMFNRLTRGGSDSIAALSEDHARAAGAEQLRSSDRAAVAQWIAGHVHFAMYVPQLSGAQIRGARIRLVDGRRGAVVEYDVNGTALSYFVTPDRSSLGVRRNMTFEHHVHDGYRLVLWRDAGLEHAMVGDLPDALLVRLSQSCIDQARARVATRGRHSILL